MRNTWIEVSVDGRENDVETGPRSSDGGSTVLIHQNVLGESEQILRACTITDEGKITTYINVWGETMRYVSYRSEKSRTYHLNKDPENFEEGLIK